MRSLNYILYKADDIISNVMLYFSNIQIFVILL